MCTHELICAIDRKVLKMLSISNGFRVFAAYKKYQRQKTPPMLWPPTVVPLCVQCVRYINTHTHKHTFSHSILVSNIRHSLCVCLYVVLLNTFYPIHNVVWSFIVLRCSFCIYHWMMCIASFCLCPFEHVLYYIWFEHVDDSLMYNIVVVRQQYWIREKMKRIWKCMCT